MSADEKLDAMFEMMVDLKHEMTEVKADVGELKREMTEVKADVGELKREMAEVKADVNEMKQEMSEFRSEMDEMKLTVTKLTAKIEYEVAPNIVKVAEAHEIIYDHSINAENIANKTALREEMRDIRMSIIENDIRELKKTASIA